MDPEANPHRDDDEPMGVGIGGAAQEQRRAWGRVEYARQAQLGIGIGGASLEQRQRWAQQRAENPDRQHQEDDADRPLQD